jgi:hypothetical protein
MRYALEGLKHALAAATVGLSFDGISCTASVGDRRCDGLAMAFLFGGEIAHCRPLPRSLGDAALLGVAPPLLW